MLAAEAVARISPCLPSRRVVGSIGLIPHAETKRKDFYERKRESESLIFHFHCHRLKRERERGRDKRIINEIPEKWKPVGKDKQPQRNDLTDEFVSSMKKVMSFRCSL